MFSNVRAKLLSLKFRAIRRTVISLFAKWPKDLERAIIIGANSYGKSLRAADEGHSAGAKGGLAARDGAAKDFASKKASSASMPRSRRRVRKKFVR